MNTVLADLRCRTNELESIGANTPLHSAKIQNVYNILNPLKEIQFKPEFYDAMRKEGENKEETDEKYETLYDFVNISSLQELNSKAQEAYGAYEGSLNSLRYSINFLIKTIEGTLNSIKETEESRNTLVKKIQHCNTEITEISQQISTHRKLLDYKATEENKNDKSPIVDAMLMLSNKAKDVLCRLSEAETEIKKINVIKKEKHIALTANTQIVKEKLGKLEQEMAMFETAYSALRNIYAQCDSLIECYSKYSTSYQSFFEGG